MEVDGPRGVAWTGTHALVGLDEALGCDARVLESDDERVRSQKGERRCFTRRDVAATASTIGFDLRWIVASRGAK